MTDEEKVMAVVSALDGHEYAYDNPERNVREFWENGRIVLERKRHMCDGEFYAEWGTYPVPTPV